MADSAKVQRKELQNKSSSQGGKRGLKRGLEVLKLGEGQIVISSTFTRHDASVPNMVKQSLTGAWDHLLHARIRG